MSHTCARQRRGTGSEEKKHQAILQRALSGKPDAKLDQEALAVDWALHDRMVDAMGNEILSEIYRANSLHVRMIRLDAAGAAAARGAGDGGHMEVLDILFKATKLLRNSASPILSVSF